MKPTPDTSSGSRQGSGRAPLGRRLITAFLVVGVAALVLNVLAGSRGLPAVLEARRQLEAATADLAGIREENARLRADVQRLRSDPAAIEEIARQELGLVRPGEKVFIIRDAGPPGR